MSHSLPPCPACASTLTYEDGDLLICPECGHEWSAAAAAEQDDDALVVKDANGNLLQDGDTVTVIKDLKIKGASSVVKVGTKVKNIRLVGGGPQHRLQDRWRGSHEAQVGVCAQGLMSASATQALYFSCSCICSCLR